MKKFEDFYKMTLVHFGTVSQKTGLKFTPPSLPKIVIADEILTLLTPWKQ